MNLSKICQAVWLITILGFILSCSKDDESSALSNCDKCPTPKPKRSVYLEAKDWHSDGDSLYWTDIADTLRKVSNGYTYIDHVYLELAGGDIELNQPIEELGGYVNCDRTYLSFTPNPRRPTPLPFKSLSLRVVVD